MNTILPATHLILGLVLSGTACLAASPAAALKSAASTIKLEKDRLAVQATLVAFEEAPEMEPYFRESFGCVVFPTIGKGGFGVGGAHGKGWVFRKNSLTGESKMTQVTVGFQWGGQAFSEIIFLEDDKAYSDFTSGEFEFGAQASAVAVNAGVSAAASTSAGTTAGANLGSAGAQLKTNYTNGMAVFTRTKGGLMYEAALGGQKFKFKARKN